MNREELRRHLAQGLFTSKQIDELIQKIMPSKEPRPKQERPVYVHPAHETHEKQMAWGSALLGEGIERMLRGEETQTPADFLWRGSPMGTKTYENPIRKDDTLPEYILREPCGRCGVRHDVHKQFGCRRYVRGAVG